MARFCNSQLIVKKSKIMGLFITLIDYQLIACGCESLVGLKYFNKSFGSKNAI